MPETIDIQIDPEFSRLIPPLAPEELAQLESSILAEGCRDALVVWRGLLLDGHNRLSICQQHGLPYKTVLIDLDDREEAADWIIANQLGRRNLNPDQFKVLLGEMYNRAKKAVPNPDGIGGKSGKIVEDQIDPQQSTADRIADQFQVSAPTVKRAGALVRTMTPEAKQAVLTGQATLLQVKREQREAKREERRQENAVKAQAVEPIRAGAKFATIVVDPPWDWADEGDVNQMGRAKPDYATMPLEDLFRLPIPELSDEDCHLYLWVTNRSLPKAFDLMETWGFRYVTTLTWPKPSFGMGNYFRGQTEHVLFGVKGSQMLRRKDASTLLPAWSRGPDGHSSKPPEFHSFVESCSPGPYLDMFSRKRPDNWIGWGADA
jgi:N6-adenosine-specific RNA methylase IME4